MGGGVIYLKQKGRNNQHINANYESTQAYKEARSNISYIQTRVQALSKLGRKSKGIQDAVRASRISELLSHQSRKFTANQLGDFTDELFDRLFDLEQTIVLNNRREAWDKDLRLVFMCEALTLVKRAKQLDEAELTPSYNELTLVRRGAVTHYGMNRDGLSACICDVLNYIKEDELRQERTNAIFDAGGFSSYITANTRARNLISAERFAELLASTPLVEPTPTKSKRKQNKRRRQNK